MTISRKNVSKERRGENNKTSDKMVIVKHSKFSAFISGEKKESRDLFS